MSTEASSNPSKASAIDWGEVVKVSASYIAILAALAYPFAFVAAWIQIHDWWYVGETEQSLFLTSLLPHTLVVGKALYVVGWAILSGLILLGSTSVSRLIARSRITAIALSVSLSAIYVAIVIYLEMVASELLVHRTDTILLLVFVAAILIGTLGAYFVTGLLLNAENRGQLNWRWRYLVPFATVPLAAIVAAACVLGVQGPELPDVVLWSRDDVTLQKPHLDGQEGTLLSYSNGVWHVLYDELNGDTEVVTLHSMPNNSVEEVHLVLGRGDTD